LVILFLRKCYLYKLGVHGFFCLGQTRNLGSLINRSVVFLFSLMERLLNGLAKTYRRTKKI